jgi:hypothetical protein
MQDVEIAQCVPGQQGLSSTNAVLVSSQYVYKKGVKLVPSTPANMMQKPTGLSASKPE